METINLKNGNGCNSDNIFAQHKELSLLSVSDENLFLFFLFLRPLERISGEDTVGGGNGLIRRGEMGEDRERGERAERGVREKGEEGEVGERSKRESRWCANL